MFMKEESDSVMKSDTSRIKPASANLHFCGRKHPGNKTETLEEIYQNQEEIPKSNVTRFVVTVEKLIELKG